MTFVLFGATGDLAKRKIYPALFNLYLNRKLPKSFSVMGVGREEFSDVEFQSRVIDSLYTFSRHLLNGNHCGTIDLSPMSKLRQVK